MSVQQANTPKINWDANIKRDVVNYIRWLGDRIRDYLCYAVEYANSQKGTTKEQFWSNLFISDESGESIQKERGKVRKEPCPDNPYDKQDIQAMCKYLLYGKNRKFPNKNIKDDSQNYYNVFKIKRSPRFSKPWQDTEYESNLRTAINKRNDVIGHATQATEQTIDWKYLNTILETYKVLTKEIGRNDAWRTGLSEHVDKVKDFWKRQDREISDRFGSAPLNLMELGQILFSKTEALSEKEQAKLQEIVRQMRLDEKNGWVYGWSSQEDLLDLMRLCLTKGEMTQEDAQAAMEEQRQAEQAREEAQRQMEEREAQMTAPLWTPVPWEAARALRRGREGSMLPLTDRLWQALLGGFQLLVDESIFLSEDGRRLLEKLQSLLTMSRGILAVDASVVSSIFRQYRSTKPYTKLELAEMEPVRRR